MFSSKLRVGIVGAGYFGNVHAKTYLDLENVDLVGIADKNLDRATALCKKYHCQPFSDGTELIGKIDAASIVVPASAHSKIAEPFLQAKIPILVEKPLAPSLEEGQALVDLSRKTNTLLLTGHYERFNPGFKALASHVKNLRWLEMTRLSTFGPRNIDVSVISDLMIHDIDLALLLADSQPVAIEGTGISVLSPHTDLAHAQIIFNNGVTAHLSASRISSYQQRSIMAIIGDKTEITANLIEQRAWIKKIDLKENDCLGDAPIKPVTQGIRNFIAAIAKQEAPFISAEEALRAVNIADKINYTIKS